MAEDTKKMAQELGTIRMFLMNSVETIFMEMQNQTSALLSIQDAIKGIKPDKGSGAMASSDDKANKSNKSAGGTINIKDFMKDLLSIATVMPKFTKAMKELKSSQVKNFNIFLRNMTKAITQDGKYGEPAQIQALYKTVAQVFSDLGDSIGKFSRGLIWFGIVAKLKLDDLFIKFIDKFFDKDRMSKLDPEPAEKAGKALVALAKGIGLFALILAVSGPLFILGLPSLVIGLPIILGAFFLFAKLSKQADDIKQAKDALIGMSIALLSLALAMIMMRFVTPKDMLMTVGLLAVFALFLFVTKLVGGKGKDSPGAQAMIAFGIGLIALTGAMILMKYVEWESIFKAVLIMGVLSLMFLIVGMMKGGAKDAAILMGTIALSMVALVLVMMAYEKVSWEAIGKGMLVMGGLGLIVWWLGRESKHTKWGLFTMVAIVLALWALSEIIPLYAKLSWEDLGKAGAVVAGLGLVVWLMGKRANETMKGAGALLLATAAVGGLVYILRMFANAGMTWEMLGMLGASVVGLGLAMAIAGAGSIPGYIAAGALAMGLAGGALYVITAALKNFASAGMTWEMLGMLGSAVVGLGLSMAIAGATSFLIIPGAAAMLLAGGALIAIAAGLKSVAGIFGGLTNLLADSGHVTESFMGFGGGRMMSNLEYMLYAVANSFTINPLSITSMYATAPAFMFAGKALYEIAQGLLAIVKLNVPLDTLPGTIEGILTAVSMPFAKIGAMQDVGGGWLGIGAQNPVAKGIASVNGIGRVLIDIARGVQAFANLTFTDSDGKKIAIPLADLSEGGKIPVAIRAVLTAVGSAFSEIGASGGETYWWSTSNIQKGILAVKGAGTELAALAKGVQEFANLTFTGADGKKIPLDASMLGKDGTVAQNIKNALSAISGAFGEIGASPDSALTYWAGKITIAAGIKSANELVVGIANVMKNVKNTNDWAQLVPVKKFDKQVKGIMGVLGNIAGAVKPGDLDIMARRGMIFTATTNNIVTIARVKDSLASVATSMDKISNSLVRVLTTLDKIAGEKLDKLNEVFSNLIEVGKLDGDNVDGIFNNVGNIGQGGSGGGFNIKNLIPSPPSKPENEKDEITRLKAENMSMQQLLAKLATTMDNIDRALSGTLVVQMSQDNLNLLKKGG